MIVIIGAGISGLALAHQLAERAQPFVVLEATQRVGGVIRSGRVDGHLLEWGPQRARLTQDLSRLVDELGLRDRLIEAPRDLPLLVYRDGRLSRVPFSARAFLTSDILSVRGRLRAALEPLTRGASDDETVAAFFTRKIGREAYENIAGPLYGGLYASDPADMLVGLSLGHALSEFGIERSLLAPLIRRGGRVTTPPACTFAEGLEELPRALYERHRAHVRLGTPVRGLRRAGELAEYGVRWRVEIDGGHIDATDVVITTPAGAAVALLRNAAPEEAERVARLVYNPLAVVHVHAATGPRALGYQVSLAEDLVTRGVTFNDALFDRRGLYTMYLGGARNPWVAEAPDEELERIALEEFRVVTGADARVLSIARERMPAWDRSWEATQGLELPVGLHLHANWASRPGIPGRLAGARHLAERLATGA